MSNEVIGKIKSIGKTEEVGGSGFTKRQLVLEVQDGKYKNDMALDFVKDNTVKLDDFSEGETVEVGFNIRSNEHKGRYYTNLTGWRITKSEGEAATDQESDGDVPF